MITGLLAEALARGPLTIGQIRVHPDFVIHHAREEREAQAEVFHSPEAAANLARWDESGAFRPLKTAPNLRRGWRLELECLGDVRLAIEYFYPSALGHAAARLRGEFRPVALRDYLARQSGMYAVTRKATDAEIEECIREVCGPGRCLNHIAWEVAKGLPAPRLAP
ncbi:MAG: DR2241 family protein [Terrimicrobiaceae bacterium]|nr:DR2241 family protein [Terrimicrobiaceae bacterium]